MLFEQDNPPCVHAAYQTFGAAATGWWCNQRPTRYGDVVEGVDNPEMYYPYNGWVRTRNWPSNEAPESWFVNANRMCACCRHCTTPGYFRYGCGMKHGYRALQPWGVTAPDSRKVGLDSPKEFWFEGECRKCFDCHRSYKINHYNAGCSDGIIGDLIAVEGGNLAELVPKHHLDGIEPDFERREEILERQHHGHR